MVYYLRGSGGLPPEVEEFWNFHVGKRHILSLFYTIRKIPGLQNIFYGNMENVNVFFSKAEEFFNFQFPPNFVS